MFWFFGGRKEVERVEEDTKRGFEGVKKDISAISSWIKHLDSEKNLQQKDINELKDLLSNIKEEIDGTLTILIKSWNKVRKEHPELFED